MKNITPLPKTRLILAAAVVAFSGGFAWCGEANHELAARFTADKLMQLVEDNTVKPVWLGGGGRFWYTLSQAAGYRFFLVDVESRKKTEIEVDPRVVGRNVVEFEIEGCAYRFDMMSRKLDRLDGPDSVRDREWLVSSPDGRWAAYVQSGNIFLESLGEEKTAKQITFDGEMYYGFEARENGLFENEAERERSIPQKAAVTWSPDSRKFVAFRQDYRRVEELWVVDSLHEPRPELVTFKSRFPGEELAKNEVWIYNLAREKLMRVEPGLWSDPVFEGMTWSKDSSRLFVGCKSPDRLRCRLLAVDAETGKCSLLFEEEVRLADGSRGQVLTKPLRELDDDGGLLLWSRRDGWGHYSLHDRTGRLERSLTSGRFNVDAVVHVDEERQSVYFTANGREEGRNPYYLHLYSVGLDGAGLKLLTPEDAHHEIHFSPSGDCFVDTWSRVDVPPVSALRDLDGKVLLELERTDAAGLEKAGWKPPEIVMIPAADGTTELWGVMWKPFDLDPGRKVPVIAMVYPGPQDELVPLTFFQALFDNHIHLAQFGFVVVMSGNRGGSYKRSLEYSEYHRGNLRDYPLADNKAFIEGLAERFPFIDIERVGIWGGSSGGFMAASAMLTYPGFYKVGVARSGPHDPGRYHGWWNDLFHGMREVEDGSGGIRWESEVAPSNLEIARNLEGRLLIIHGERDTIVHPLHSARLADALMAANKRFDYFVVPGADHGWGRRWQYEQRRIWMYFIEHLLGDRRYSADIFDDFADR